MVNYTKRSAKPMIRIELSTRLGELRWSQADLSRATKIRPNTTNEIYNISRFSTSEEERLYLQG